MEKQNTIIQNIANSIKEIDKSDKNEKIVISSGKKKKKVSKGKK
jgi:hypothetical protein